MILTCDIWFNVDIGPVPPDGNVAPILIGRRVQVSLGP